MELALMDGFGLLLAGISAILAMPGVALLTIILAARTHTSAVPTSTAGSRPSVAIVVPAHNESLHLVPTLQNLKPQLLAHDRLLVVADNCSDDTAEVARRESAWVVERHDVVRRGKGFALAFAVDALRADPPEVLVVVDADCLLAPQAVARLATQCARSQRPVQLLDLMVAAPGSDLRTRLMEFAWLIKNRVRPMGTSALGDACHLMGTGMALPWAIASQAQLGTGHVAEDMKLGIDCALAGLPPKFLDSACVTSAFPDQSDVARTQKTRWEHGHLRTMREELPRMLLALFHQPSMALLVMTMDLMIPPLALYLVFTAFHVVLWSLAAWVAPLLLPACIASWIGALAFCLAVLLAWKQHARHLISAVDLLMVPWYAAWKFPVYLAYAMNRKSAWTRTQRKVQP